jgi:competence protein ComFC
MKNLGGAIWDYLFPIFCLSCNKEGFFVCGTCLEKVKTPGFFACPICDEKNTDGSACESCPSYIKKQISMVGYHESLLGNIIQELKYNFVEDLAEPITTLTNQFLSKNILPDVDVIVSIPLHKRRFAERGFNQSDVIANILYEQIGKPVSYLLKRKKYTKKQSKLTKSERQHNLKDVFVVNSEDVDGKVVLLVDDVYTTGATMQMAAKVLLDGGALDVIGFSLARG